MKRCPECGKAVFRTETVGDEYGSPVVDGLRYPERCPHCGAVLD